jgi:transcriptional regulator with XRE-family HTH domain
MDILWLIPYWASIYEILNVMAQRSTDEYEAVIGAQVRRLRIDADLTQEELADRADRSTLTIHNLETGKGSTLHTLIRVLRVLDRADWLEDLAPDSGPSPLELLREARGEGSRRRVRRRDDGAL